MRVGWLSFQLVGIVDAFLLIVIKPVVTLVDFAIPVGVL